MKGLIMRFGMQRITVVLASLALVACGDSGSDRSSEVAEENAETVVDNAALASELALSSIVIDTHIDVPFRLERQAGNPEREMDDVAAATTSGDFDYPRAVAGGLNAPFMSIYTPAQTEAAGTSYDLANKLIDLMEGVAAAAPDKFAITTSVAGVRANFEAGIISLPLGMENGSPIAGDLANLKHFYDRGIRYITLAHGLSNHISDSSYDDNKQWDGLSPFGEDVVREMNALGIMVDISHVSDAAFYDVIAITSVPVIASHSSARHFTPGFERNMNDDMIRVLGENGGVVMINYGSSFLTEVANGYNDGVTVAWEAYAEENDLDAADFGLRIDWAPSYREANPYPYATLEDVVAHIDHVVELAGIDHVGIGSDYDGVGDSLPVGLKDVSSYPTLIEGLLDSGYSEDDVRKIMGENLLRVWAAVEAGASASAE